MSAFEVVKDVRANGRNGSFMVKRVSTFTREDKDSSWVEIYSQRQGDAKNAPVSLYGKTEDLRDLLTKILSSLDGDEK